VSIFDTAQATLTQHGLTGRLEMITPNLWQLRGQIGTKGAAAQFDGEPDQALLNDAAGQIRDALAGTA